MLLSDLIEHKDPHGRASHDWALRDAESIPFAIRWYDLPAGGTPVVQLVGPVEPGWRWSVYRKGRRVLHGAAGSLVEALYVMDQSCNALPNERERL